MMPPNPQAGCIQVPEDLLRAIIARRLTMNEAKLCMAICVSAKRTAAAFHGTIAQLARVMGIRRDETQHLVDHCISKGILSVISSRDDRYAKIYRVTSSDFWTVPG